MRALAITGVGLFLGLRCSPLPAQDLFDGLGQGVQSNAVYCLYADPLDTTLYLSGWFYLAGDTLISPGVVQWDGQQYAPLGCGINWDCVGALGPGAGAQVVAIEEWNDGIYFGGYFDHAGVQPVNNIARWDGAQWHAVGGGIDGPIYSIKPYPDGVYVAGAFNHADTVSAEGLARWDGSQWHDVHDLPLLDGTGGNLIKDVEIYNGEVYIGGNFTDGVSMRDIARFDGSEWVVVGNGFIGTVSEVKRMAVHDGLLYVAGAFSNGPPYGHPSNPGSGILAWDGSNWIDLGGGTNGSSTPSVTDMAWHNDTLYVCGFFDRIGGIPCDYLAKWDGTQWCCLVPPGSLQNTIPTLEFYRDTLHVGGGFVQLMGDTVNHVAKWVGGNWVDSCGHTTSVGELSAAASHFSYDPGSSVLRIPSFDHLQSSHLEVFDLLGRVLLRRAMNEGKEVLLTGLAPGAYIARLIATEGASVTGKFVVP